MDSFNHKNYFSIKFSYIILIFAMCLSSAAQDMQRYLMDTKQMVHAGNYAEANERYIWFQNHVLEKNESMKGVRLSFALADWKNLGDAYPPALKAMKEMRDMKTRQLKDSIVSPELFQDIEAINETLGERNKTVILFDSLTLKSPELANYYWQYARESLFKLKRYDIIRKYIPNPRKEFYNLREKYREDSAEFSTGDEFARSAKFFNETDFVLQSIHLIQLCLATSDTLMAQQIQKSALDVLNDDRLRTAIPR